MRRHPAPSTVPRSGFADFRFPPDVIMVAVRWYLRYGLSYRDVEELLTERGIEVDLLVRDAPRSMVAMTRWYRSAVLVPRAALARSRAQRSDSP
jgi:transposase-like protein